MKDPETELVNIMAQVKTISKVAQALQKRCMSIDTGWKIYLCPEVGRSHREGAEDVTCYELFSTVRPLFRPSVAEDLT
jgi:hypothetical protein